MYIVQFHLSILASKLLKCEIGLPSGWIKEYIYMYIISDMIFKDNWFLLQESKLSFHNDSFRLGELRLHLMSSTGQMFKDGSLNVNVKLQTCTLDDLREGIERATSRFVRSELDVHGSGWTLDLPFQQALARPGITRRVCLSCFISWFEVHWEVSLPSHSDE